MTFRGRPLRFVAIVLLGWVAARVYLVEPFANLSDDAPPPATAAPARAEIAAARAAGPDEPAQTAVPASLAAIVRTPGSRVAAAGRPAHDHRIDTGRSREAAVRVFETPLRPSPPVRPAADARVDDAGIRSRPRGPGRFGGYAYAFVREGGGGPGLSDGPGQLGGSQAGVRLDYAIGRALDLSARFSAPLGTARGREAAFGVKWRPGGAAALTLSLERRVALGRGGRDAFALMAAGGVGPVTLPAGFRLEAYGQAGVVGLNRRDMFADGQVTALREVARRGRTRLALGAGAWGGAQPGVERIDAGPRARLGFDLGNGRGAGLSLDYRRRIAGNAEPGSGATLTLDTSF